MVDDVVGFVGGLRDPSIPKYHFTMARRIITEVENILAIETHTKYLKKLQSTRHDRRKDRNSIS